MQEGDRQIWGQVIKMNGHDATRDRHMEICERNHKLQTFLGGSSPTQDKEPDWNSFQTPFDLFVLHRDSFSYAPKIILKGLMSD